MNPANKATVDTFWEIKARKYPLPFTSDNQLIRELLARHSDTDNTIHHTTSMEQGVLIWHI